MSADSALSLDLIACGIVLMLFGISANLHSAAKALDRIAKALEALKK